MDQAGITKIATDAADLIYEMSQIFAVSKQAMQIRLQSHNLM